MTTSRCETVKVVRFSHYMQEYTLYFGIYVLGTLS